MIHDCEAIVENSPDGIARLDLAGRFMYVNAETERMFGLSRDDILGKTNRELAVPDALADAAEMDFRRVAETGQPMTRTYSYPLNQRFYEARLVPEFDDAQNVVSILVMSRDVTDRVCAARSLRDQRDFAEELVNTVREPMLVLDSQFVVKSANASFEDRFGVTSAELTGTPLDELVGGRFNVQGLEALLRRILGTPRQSFDGFDVEMDVPGRGRRTMRVNARQIDHLQLILLAMEDVTQQVEAIAGLKDDLRRRNEHLNDQTKRLRQLVVELSETEDRERQRLADLLHDDLQQMLVGVSFHLEMAESQCSDNAKAAGLLAQAKDLLAETIVKSRDLSHELSPATFRTQGIRGGLKWLAEQMHRQHRLEVGLKVEGEVDEMAEPIRMLLYKAIREMLFNIVKHAEVNHANVVVTREPGHVEVTVADHGRGFDVDAVLNNKSGQGLGLFSIRERLNLLDGRLGVESTRGKGSRFRLFVPLNQQDLEDASSHSRLTQHETASQEAGSSNARAIRILVVDDHIVMRQGIARLLDDHPRIQVLDEAENGREALEKVRRHKPDLVLMDYRMPELDGVEATRRIAAEHPEVRIVALSMYHEPGMADQMLQAGAHAFVQKTAPASELLTTIQDVCDDRSFAGSANW
jgi:PAS domain S-box-containing protein